MAKAYVCIVGSLLGVPTMALCCFSNVHNTGSYFYLCMTGLAFEYLAAECWGAPAIAMLQNTISAKNRGFSIAAYLFAATIAGTIAVQVFAAIISEFHFH
jgi:hypothetical protein